MDIYVNELIKEMEQISLLVIYSISIFQQIIDTCSIIQINISDFPFHLKWIA